MKTEFTEVSETRKHLAFEIPTDVVDAEIDRITKRYAKSVQVPGFRQGKVPPTVVRQRFKEQILHDVAHDLIPRVVGDAMRERGLKPVASPDIKDLVLEAGQPLTFMADFETLPPIDPGEYTGLTIRKAPAVLDVGAVDEALDHLRERHARWKPVEDRPAEGGDTVLMDLIRTRRTSVIELPGENRPAPGGADDKPEHLQNASIELGVAGNPPEFEQQVMGVSVGDTRTFTITHPADDETLDVAGATVDYVLTVKGIRRKELLPLDDDFAKEISDVETLEALRDKIREDLTKGATREAEHRMRHELLQQISSRLKTAPDVLIEQEIDRRLEEFVRRLMDQGVDPVKAQVDWKEFRERQRDASLETVKSTLVLDEIGRRESIEASDADVEAEVAKFAERASRTPDEVRARLEEEGAFDRIRAGIRREKTMSWLLEKANIVG